MEYPLYIVFVTLASLGVVQVGANPDAKRLYDDIIMKHYNRNVRPAISAVNSTIIKFGIVLAQIVDVDEVNQIMTVNLWAQQQWTDPRFVWNIREYNNITTLFVPAEKLWKPDIVLYNNADGDYVMTSSGKAVIEPDGMVTYNPPMQFKSSCEIDVQYFPFDEQMCHMKFGPWTHDKSKVDVMHLARNPAIVGRQNIPNGIILTEYMASAEWDLIEVTAKENIIKYPCCIEEYPDVTFNITIRRKPLYYVINLIVPCMSMNILTIVVFYLPSYSGEKIGVTFSVFLAMSLFQLLLFDMTPSSSLSLPLIGKYIMVSTFLIALSAVANVLILNFNHRMSSTHKMSRIVHWLFLDVLAKFLCMRDAQQPGKNMSPLEEHLTSYNSNYTDLSHYPPFEETYSNIDKFCDACNKRNQGKYASNINKGLDGVMFIAKHCQDTDDGKKVQEDWRFVALIFDRVLLWVYTIITIVITLEIYMNAPALYTDRKPIDLDSMT